eukprot:4033553-Alexandrium_andersonii.AAC.1
MEGDDRGHVYSKEDMRVVDKSGDRQGIEQRNPGLNVELIGSQDGFPEHAHCRGHGQHSSPNLGFG